MSKQTRLLSDQAQQAARDSIESAKRVERQLQIAAQQAQASVTAAQAQQRQLEITDRAWIQVEVAPNTDLPANSLVGGPLTFDDDGTGHLSRTIILHNIGHSVATDVQIRDATVVQPEYATLDPWLPVNEQRALCRSKKYAPYFAGRRRPNYTVFPNSDTKSYELSTFQTKDIPDAPRELHLRLGKPVTLYLIGCVDYRYGLSSQLHQTGFVLEVFGGPDRQGIQTKMIVQPEKLTFLPCYLGGDYAN